MAARVVIIPGLMGSALRDTLNSPPKNEALCAEHWEQFPKLRDYLQARNNELCGYDSDLVWGRLQFLHWMADLKGWLEIMSSGDGYKDPGRVDPKGLTGLLIKINEQKKKYIDYQPYYAMIDALTKHAPKPELLQAPFDWRMNVHQATDLLERMVLKKWFNGRAPDKPAPARDRVILIGHSLGGVIARQFVEDPMFSGHKVTSNVILVGTPNRGAPNAFGYFTGTKKFFQDSMLWQYFEWAQSKQNGKTSLGQLYGINEKMFSEEDQQRLVELFTSIIQLFPTYDFVKLPPDDGGFPEPWAETYKDKKHEKTRLPVAVILGQLASQLRDVRSLDAWLTRHRIVYDFWATTKLKTTVSMQKSRSKTGYKLITEKKGDGTVPVFSSLDWARETKSLAAMNFFVTKKGGKTAQHPELCKHPEVIKHCLKRLKGIKYKKPPGDRLHRGNVPEYLAVAKDIFRKGREPFKQFKEARGTVLCVALIEAGDNDPLIDLTEVVENKRRRLVRPPPGTLSTGYIYSGTTGKLKYDFVLIGGTSNDLGGVLFLPKPGEGFLHVFCVISKDWFDWCKNDGHSEMQFARLFEAMAQDRTWLRRITSIFLWNETLLTGRKRKKNEGYSPCAFCCDDLATLVPGLPIVKYMEWNTLYPGREKCGSATSLASLGKMEANGWRFQGPKPTK